jgi:hypothetical protein
VIASSPQAAGGWRRRAASGAETARDEPEKLAGVDSLPALLGAPSTQFSG